MTTTDNTLNKLSQNTNIGANSTISDDDIAQAVMLLRLVRDLKPMLYDIRLQSTPVGNAPLVRFVKHVADVSRAANMLLTPVTESSDCHYSESFF